MRSEESDPKTEGRDQSGIEYIRLLYYYIFLIVLIVPQLLQCAMLAYISITAKYDPTPPALSSANMYISHPHSYGLTEKP